MSKVRQQNNALLRRVSSYLKPYFLKLTLIVFLVAAISFSSLISPYILKIIIDDIFPAKDYAYLINILALLVLVNLARLLLELVADYLYESTSSTIIMNIRLDLFNHVLKLPMNVFDETRKGDIVQRLNHDIGTMEGVLAGGIIRFLHNLLTIIGLGVALSILNFKLFVISLVVFPLIYFSLKYFHLKMMVISDFIKKKDGELTAYLIEAIENIQIIKAFNTYRFERSRLQTKNTELINANVKQTTLHSASQGMSVFFISLSPIIIFGWGGASVMEGVMTLGTVVAFLQYLNRLFIPFKDLIRHYVGLLPTISSLKRVFEFFSLETENINMTTSGKMTPIREIRIEGLDFSYSAKTIFSNLNLVFKKGKKYAIVGRSGIGKSTLFKLLGYYYKDFSGSITINDCSIRNIDVATLRNSIGYITQDVKLFSDSILANIQCGDKSIDSQEIQTISKISGLSDLTPLLQEGLYTHIGDQGFKLSGGQRQRVAIARAISHCSPVMIFDESTSSLDSQSETHLWDEVMDYVKADIIIAISHRLSTVRRFDEILCIDDGKIVERGTHEELIAGRGFYFNLFYHQMHENESQGLSTTLM